MLKTLRDDFLLIKSLILITGARCLISEAWLSVSKPYGLTPTCLLLPGTASLEKAALSWSLAPAKEQGGSG